MTSKRALLRILEREREAFAAERRLLIEQICHLTRSPWTVSPADMRDIAVEPEDDTEPVLVEAHHWPE